MVLSNARSINNIRSRNQVRILICFYSIIILEKLKGYFGYKVKINPSKNHQKLVIEYNDDEGLESILNKLKIKL